MILKEDRRRKKRDFRDLSFMERIIYRTVVLKREDTEAKNITLVPLENSPV